jgi:hypothetical protein
VRPREKPPNSAVAVDRLSCVRGTMPDALVGARTSMLSLHCCSLGACCFCCSCAGGCSATSAAHASAGGYGPRSPSATAGAAQHSCSSLLRFCRCGCLLVLLALLLVLLRAGPRCSSNMALQRLRQSGAALPAQAPAARDQTSRLHKWLKMISLEATRAWKAPEWVGRPEPRAVASVLLWGELSNLSYCLNVRRVWKVPLRSNAGEQSWCTQIRARCNEIG